MWSFGCAQVPISGCRHLMKRERWDGSQRKVTFVHGRIQWELLWTPAINPSRYCLKTLHFLDFMLIFPKSFSEDFVGQDGWLVWHLRGTALAWKPRLQLYIRHRDLLIVENRWTESWVGIMFVRGSSSVKFPGRLTFVFERIKWNLVMNSSCHKFRADITLGLSRDSPQWVTFTICLHSSTY